MVLSLHLEAGHLLLKKRGLPGQCFNRLIHLTDQLNALLCDASDRFRRCYDHLAPSLLLIDGLGDLLNSIQDVLQLAWVICLLPFACSSVDKRTWRVTFLIRSAACIICSLPRLCSWVALAICRIIPLTFAALPR